MDTNSQKPNDMGCDAWTETKLSVLWCMNRDQMENRDLNAREAESSRCVGKCQGWPTMMREAGSIAKNEIEVTSHVLHHNKNPKSFWCKNKENQKIIKKKNKQVGKDGIFLIKVTAVIFKICQDNSCYCHSWKTWHNRSPAAV